MKFFIKYKQKIIRSFSIFLITYLAIMLAIIFSGLNDHLFKADLIVVLGSQVSPNGEPSPGLTTRLNKAIELYQQRYAPHIIVSGGLGKEGYDESTAMAKFLIARGIPEQAIIKDPIGNNTRATATNTYHYMQQHHLQSVIIISQYYHIARTKLAFKQAGIKQIATASTSFIFLNDIYSIIREIVGYPVYLLNIK